MQIKLILLLYSFITISLLKELSCPSECMTIPGTKTCNANSECLNGCNKYFWGKKCAKTCNPGCRDMVKSNMCTLNEGYCWSDGCLKTYWG